MPTLKPLPDCEGPKLECFTDDLTKHNFKFLQLLGSGCHSTVVKAEIDGKIYVIKLFFPIFVDEPNFHMAPIDEEICEGDDDYKEPVTASDKMPQHVIDSLRVQATSFNNECRAYGRLKELGREHLAVKVHGYLRLYIHQIDEHIQSMIRSTIPDAQYTTLDVMEMNQDEADLPIMAIVKDWIPDHRKPTGEMTREAEQRQINHLPRMLRNLRQLHKCGIVVRDLKSQQYYEGHLGDFSHAWTIPHIFGPEGGNRPPWAFASMAAWDLKCFHDMVKSMNESADMAEPPLNRCKSIIPRNEERCESLRPRPSRQRPFLPMLAYDCSSPGTMDYYPPFDPALFNWRAIQKRATKKSMGDIPEKPAGGVSMKRKSTARKARQARKGNNKRGKR
ncbi:hypothetical protein BFJ72_g7814 [Fusarium proliferatum]|uniref:Protein kinase domain-containing protein n=1 Tax=Gibberella intermedia TaxID=948311 RepID=A0A420T6N0_GIBIN|nr:hypothetical protein BFJ72_g7814 [Fusarium proliferatum]